MGNRNELRDPRASTGRSIHLLCDWRHKLSWQGSLFIMLRSRSAEYADEFPFTEGGVIMILTEWLLAGTKMLRSAAER